MISSISLYPNPAQDWVVVDSWQSAIGNWQSGSGAFKPEDIVVTIYNTLGQMMDRFKIKGNELQEYMIDLSGYRTGIYTLIVSSDSIFTTQKLMVVK